MGGGFTIMEIQGHGGITHFGNSEGKGGLKCGSRPWYGMDIFWNRPMLSRFFFKTMQIRKCSHHIHSVDIAVIISSLVASLCFTFAEPFDDIFLFVKSSCALVRGNTNKSLQPKKGRSDRPTDQASEFALAHLTPILHSTK